MINITMVLTPVSFLLYRCTYLFSYKMMRQLKITKSITNHDENLDRYLHEIWKVDLISPEEEVELAKRIKKWDNDALEKLTRANLRFVVSVAKQYQNQWLSLSDLINEGNIGLIKAANKFDETRWFKFISYAVWRVRQSILQALAETASLVRLPQNKYWEIKKIKDKTNNLEQGNWYTPTGQEIAEALGQSELKIEENQRLIWTNKHISMDKFFSGDSESNLYDVLENENSPSPDEGIIREWSDIFLNKLLSSLPQQEKDIMLLYLGLDWKAPMTKSEIANYYWIDKNKVKDLMSFATKRLRNKIRESKIYDNFLG